MKQKEQKLYILIDSYQRQSSIAIFLHFIFIFIPSHKEDLTHVGVLDAFMIQVRTEKEQHSKKYADKKWHNIRYTAYFF